MLVNMDIYRSRAARLVRAVCDAVSEMNYASRRLFALRFSAAVGETDRAPDTYAEFLLRASAVSLHEPPAHCR
jgi:hypothetical protein